MLTIPVITYSFSIIDWNISEIKFRKMMTTHSMHLSKANIYCLSLPRSNGGRDLSQLELSYKTSTIGPFQYLNLSDDWMLRVPLKHKKEKGSHSVIKEAREFLQQITISTLV